MRWRQERDREGGRESKGRCPPSCSFCSFLPSLINGELGFLISNTPPGLAVSCLRTMATWRVAVDANYCELRGFNLNLEHHWRRWRRSTLRPEIEIDTCLPRAAEFTIPRNFRLISLSSRLSFVSSTLCPSRRAAGRPIERDSIEYWRVLTGREWYVSRPTFEHHRKPSYQVSGGRPEGLDDEAILRIERRSMHALNTLNSAPGTGPIGRISAATCNVP